MIEVGVGHQYMRFILISCLNLRSGQYVFPLAILYCLKYLSGKDFSFRAEINPQPREFSQRNSNIWSSAACWSRDKLSQNLAPRITLYIEEAPSSLLIANQIFFNGISKRCNPALLSILTVRVFGILLPTVQPKAMPSELRLKI